MRIESIARSIVYFFSLLPSFFSRYKKIKNLRHISRTLLGGGEIVVLNTGAVIGPEAEAMLQALHSRSIGGIRRHLEVLEKNGPKKFMSTFYVGYGHKSIGDCGTTTIFIEGVSMLAVKSIQDWPLYSGQEVSTRYVDFASQIFIDPVCTNASRDILEAWRVFYLKGVEKMEIALKERYPIQLGEKEGVYAKAIKARVFDVMRGFLPAGASTNLAWHTNLRQASDKLMLLRHHPLVEVRRVADAIEEALQEAYPDSFGHKRHDAVERYNQRLMQEYFYIDPSSCPEFEVMNDSVDRDILREYRNLLLQRPQKAELPRHIRECGTLRLRFLLDFGSFRDIQRQRAVVQRMPLLTTSHGFNRWYLDELTPDLRREAEALLAAQNEKIACLETSPEDRQYYVAIGYNVPNRLTGDLHALVYLVELRATRFVHPTLCMRARQIAKELEGRFGGYGLVLFLDEEPDRFDVKRGEHDITTK